MVNDGAEIIVRPLEWDTQPHPPPLLTHSNKWGGKGDDKCTVEKNQTVITI